MSKETLELFLREKGISAELLRFSGSVHSVAEAAREAGMPENSFIKTMVIVAGGEAAVAIIPGDRKLDLKKICLILGKKDVRIAKPDEVMRILGYPVGGVPPVFENPGKVPVFIDEGVFDKEFVLGGGGDSQTLLKISPEEIRKACGAREENLSI